MKTIVLITSFLCCVLANTKSQDPNSDGIHLTKLLKNLKEISETKSPIQKAIEHDRIKLFLGYCEKRYSDEMDEVIYLMLLGSEYVTSYYEDEMFAYDKLKKDSTLARFGPIVFNVLYKFNIPLEFERSTINLTLTKEGAAILEERIFSDNKYSVMKEIYFYMEN